MDDDGAVVTRHFIDFFLMDNFDINEYTPDGRETAHATANACDPAEGDLLIGIETLHMA